jgi:GNAT superfamily N-acetyltransferase
MAWSGVQCKGKDNYTNQKITEEELRDEVTKARSFTPALAEFTLATTAPRDVAIQTLARELTEQHKACGLFSVHVWSWEDIVESLDAFSTIVAKHYPQFVQVCAPDLYLAQTAIPRNAGIYLSSVPRPERLTLNLLPVTSFPPRLFRAKTRFRKPAELWARLRTLEKHPAAEWALHEGYLYCFHDVLFTPWSKVCNAKKPENLATNDFAFSPDPARRRLFVQLLNRCLRELLRKHYVRFSEEKRCFYFSASPDFSERKQGKRTVFVGYHSKSDPDRIAYYRHVGFRPRFHLFGKTWHLEVTPTYHFTSDGKNLSRYYEDLLSGIKLRERQNKTHLAQVSLWADLLRGGRGKGNGQRQLWDAVEKHDEWRLAPYPFLTFGTLPAFEVDFGIDDAAWLPEPTNERDDDPNQLRMFDA